MTMRTGDLVSLPKIIGLPPGGYTSDDMIKNTMPTMKLFPSKADWKAGLSLYNVKSDMVGPKGYRDQLQNLGFNLNNLGDKYITIAYLADNFPTDTFSSEYGESLLQRGTDAVSKEAAALLQFTGATNLGDLARKGGELLSKKGGKVGEKTGGFITDFVNSSAAAMDKAAAAGGIVGTGTNLLKMGARMLAGARIDFPGVWVNSSFSPSYSLTVRLYNPNPYSAFSTHKYIVGPLAAILLAALPKSDDGDTYRWPFIHKIDSPGIYGLSPAVITNVVVIKGGDQQSIAYNQRMGIVDVRIDFGSLFNSIIVDTSDEESKTGRPTLRGYLESFETEKTVIRPNRQTGPSGISKTPETIEETKGIEQKPSKNNPITTSTYTSYEVSPPERIAGDNESATTSLTNDSVYTSLGNVV